MDDVIGREAHDMEVAERLYATLRDYPSDGKLHSVDLGTRGDLILAGFIEKREIKKACPTCGTMRLDHSWFHITGGGRLFMRAMAALSAKDEGGRS